MNKVTLLKGDCLQKLKELKDNSVDSVVTDPPYEIGFMGKGWDDSGIANNPKLWKEVLRVLKPGGHLLSFSHSRTYHRQAVAVEDAGFEIRDQIMWIYGSGFPKSHNIGKSVDKLQGNKREVVGTKGLNSFKGTTMRNHYGDYNKSFEEVNKLDRGFTPYEGWGTALKPAHEPIVLARKPFNGTVAKNVLEWGTGGINIDESRIKPDDAYIKHIEKYSDRDVGVNGTPQSMFGNTHGKMVYGNVEGRFPANIIFDEEAGKILDEQSGISKSGKNKLEKGTGGIWNKGTNLPIGPEYGDTGGASRFFYCPKASKKDRNEGCDELEEKQSTKQFNSGMEGKVRSDGSVIKEPIKQHNSHPTVKPTDLMAYLVRLVTPKGGVVLDPFMGSG